MENYYPNNIISHALKINNCLERDLSYFKNKHLRINEKYVWHMYEQIKTYKQLLRVYNKDVKTDIYDLYYKTEKYKQVNSISFCLEEIRTNTLDISCLGRDIFKGKSEEIDYMP